MVSSAPAIALTTVGTMTGHRSPEPGQEPSCPLRPVEAADPLGVDRRLEVGRQRRQEAECQVDPEGELLGHAKAAEGDPEVGRGDGERDREADRRHREVAHEQRHREAEGLGRDRRAEEREVEEDVRLVDGSLCTSTAGRRSC